MLLNRIFPQFRISPGRNLSWSRAQQRNPSGARQRQSGRLPWRRNHATSGANNKKDQRSSRAERILSKLPSSLQKYTRRLKDAPVSHVIAFLILHEITAVVPLLGLFGVFHYTNYVPIGYILGHFGGTVGDGMQRFERYFRRKGWFGFGAEDDEGGQEGLRAGSMNGAGSAEDAVLERWTGTDVKYKTVVEVALAYAVTKALLPVRILVSLWATPWFAGVLGRLRRVTGGKR